MSKTKEQIAVNEEASIAIDECRQWLGAVARRFENHHPDIPRPYFLEFLGTGGDTVKVMTVQSTHSREPLYVLSYSGDLPDGGGGDVPATAILMPPLERQQALWAARTELDATLGTFIVGCLQQEEWQPVGYTLTHDADQPLKMHNYPVIAEPAL